jgi:hypothetical protein
MDRGLLEFLPNSDRFSTDVIPCFPGMNGEGKRKAMIFLVSSGMNALIIFGIVWSGPRVFEKEW